MKIQLEIDSSYWSIEVLHRGAPMNDWRAILICQAGCHVGFGSTQASAVSALAEAIEKDKPIGKAPELTFRRRLKAKTDVPTGDPEDIMKEIGL